MFRVIVTLSIISCALAGGIYRVVNGKEGRIADFPYLASLQHRTVVRCGATIINRRTLITATHCFKGVFLEKLSVRYNTEYGERSGIVVPVLKYLQHPQYSPMTQDNDIAIVWTKELMDFTQIAKPIGLAESNSKLPVGKSGVVAGWGRLGEKKGFPDIFHFAFLPIIAGEKCKKSGGGGYDNHRIKETMFCAGFMGVGRTDACKSDSGGPFVYDNTLIGVVSFGDGCGRKFSPGVYASVAYFRDWIDKNMELERQGKLVINNKKI